MSKIIAKKVLLMGLDNSGKSTILLSLKDNSNILSYLKLKPTTGLNIEKIEGVEDSISIWDFGGQEQYRETYLKDFYKYTAGINKLIFVIDVQDLKRYDMALSYLKSIMDLLKRDELIVDIGVFLHKYDPNIEKLKKFENLNDIVKNQLISQIIEIIPEGYDYEIYKTTIYTIFEQNLIKKRKN